MLFDIDTQFKSLQFEWLTIQSKVTRYEKILRELRITSLVLALSLAWASLIVNIKIPVMSGVFLSFGILWWSMIYVWTLVPFTKFGYTYTPEIENNRMPGKEPEELAFLIEEARHWMRKTRIRVSMTVLLFSFGMLMTMAGFAMSVFFFNRM